MAESLRAVVVSHSNYLLQQAISKGLILVSTLSSAMEETGRVRGSGDGTDGKKGKVAGKGWQSPG